MVPADDLLPTAHAVADQMKSLNMTAHANTELKVRKALLDTSDRAEREASSVVLLS